MSSAPTANVACSAGDCTATAVHANLNVDALAAMLAGADVTLTADVAKDIRVLDALTWTSTHALRLSAGTLTVRAPVIVQSTGAIAIQDADALEFEGKGRIAFLNTSASFSYNGNSYVLVADVAGLKAAVLQNPGSFVALANDYDAGPDGLYKTPAITADFRGVLQGLGNTIKRLKGHTHSHGGSLGLFKNFFGQAYDLRLDVHLTGIFSTGAGALAVNCSGTISGVSVSGEVSAGPDSVIGGLCGGVATPATVANSSSSVTLVGSGASGWAGGLVGLTGSFEGISIARCWSTSSVHGGDHWFTGGLVGMNDGRISQSYASGPVIAGADSESGGLVGENNGKLLDTYAVGTAQGTTGTEVGGLVGQNTGRILSSYAAGAVAADSGSMVGGLVGNDVDSHGLRDTYWDIDTSGQSHGAGNDTGDAGVTGLTTAQFQAGLPSGLSAAVWNQKPAINGGLPYLRALPNP